MLAAGVTFGANVLLARYLGPAEYGIYSYMVALALLLATSVTFGGDTTALKITAQSTLGERPLLRQFFITSCTYVLALSAFVGVVAALVLCGSDIGGYSTSSVLFGLAAVPCIGVLGIACGGLQGLGSPVLAQSLLLLARPLAVGLGASLLFHIVGVAGNSTTALALECVAALLAMALAAGLLAKKLGPGISWTESRGQSLISFLRSGAGLLALNIVQILLAQTGVLVLGLAQKPNDAGLYAAAARFSTMISLGLAAINAVAAPAIGRLQRAGDFEALQVTVSTVARLSVVVALPGAIVFALFGKSLLLWVGPEFEAAYPALVVLTLGQCVNSVTGCVVHVIVMSGQHRHALRVMGTTAAAGVIGSIAVADVWGATGVAGVTATAMATWNLILAGWISRHLGIKMIAPFSWRVVTWRFMRQSRGNPLS